MNKEKITESSDLLLSITIPTWNRAQLLKESLNNLLPQVVNYSENIEIIISDNCSDDNTPEVIQEYIDLYPQLNIISFRQEYNTGYYGNFRKCKELANAKYFWLLSDNEFVNIGIIDFLINELKSSHEHSIVFLNDWGTIENKSNHYCEYRTEIVSFPILFDKAGFKITSTSAVIFPNIKDDDEIVFTEFYGNLFLGFGLLLNSFSYCYNAKIIYGTSLWSKYAQISFNVFEAFTIHLNHCITYATKNNKISVEIADIFMNNIIKNLTRWHYIKYKIYGKIYNKDFGTLPDIEKLLKNYLFKYAGFKKYLLPAIKTPRFLLVIWYYSFKLLKFFIKRI